MIQFQERKPSYHRDNMGQPGEHFAKWKRPVTEGQQLPEHAYKRYRKESSSSKQRLEWRMPGAGGRGRMGLLASGGKALVVQAE